MSPDRPANRKPNRGRSRQGSRELARQRARRRNLWIIGAVTVVILVVALVIAVATSGGGSSSDTTAAPSQAAAVLAKTTSVPGATIEGVGVGAANGFPRPVSGTALTKDGKPEVLYIGAEYCPYCATQRWAMVVAFSRFGTFSNVGLTHSSSIDVFPSTPTFTFHGSTYTSQYVAFTAVETATSQPKGNGYAALDTPTAAQEAAFKELAPGGGIPFLDFAGRYLLSGVNLDPRVLQKLTADEIATALSDPTSAVARNVLGAANTLTAAVCRLTNNQPATVCTAAIQALADQMDKT